MSIKKFKDFTFNKKDSDQKKSDDSIQKHTHTKRIESDKLSDNMSDLNDEINKIVKLKDSEYEIVGINDVSFDKPENVENIIEEATIINADLGNKEAKRGDILYITAMVKKKNVSWNSMAVLKVRIIDIYQGLSILNSLK